MADESRVVQLRDLGGTALRGGFATLAGQVARGVIQAVSLIVLARLLLPGDFGLVAMVAAAVRIGDVIRDAGLANAAIQARTLTDAQRDNLFWLNTLIGAGTGAVFVALAPALASFYGEPELVGISRWLALGFLVNGIATQFGATVARQMRFAAAAVVDVAAQASGLVLAVVIAVAGGAYWALVGQSLMISVGVCVGYWVVAGWWPGLPHRATPVRSFLSYGFHLLGSQLLEQFARAADTIVVGYRFGPASAGIYNRAFQLMALPMRQLTYPSRRIALPVLARLQDDPDAYWSFVVRGQTILLHALVPVCALAAALASPLVEIVLGPSWAEAAPVLAILLVGAVFETADQTSGWVLLSKGRTRALLALTLVTRPLLLVSIVVGSFAGMEGVATGVAGSAAVFWVLGLVWIRRTVDAPVHALWRAALRAIVGYAVPAAACALVVSATDLPSPWAQLGVGLGAAAAVLAIEVAAWPGLRRDLVTLARSRRLLSARRPPGPAPAPPQ